MSLATAEHASRLFGGFRAVDDVSMSVEPGEVVGLIGANGAGKTTLLKMLLGLLAPSSGRVSILGGQPDRDRRRHLGYVSQGLGLYGSLTAGQNLEFAASVYGAPTARLPEALLAVGAIPVEQMPLGLQRQLAFTCALLHEPKLLVLDEPTSGVDPVARARLWDTIRDQAEGGVGVLVTTHYMQEAAQCDRLLLMSAGRLVASGSEADIIGGTESVAIRTDDWAAAFAALSEAGQAVALAGTTVRVADGDPGEISHVLNAAGVRAHLEQVAATIEERMATLAREHTCAAARESTGPHD